MENPTTTSANAHPIPPALGYSGAALALWIFRRPVLALAGALIHLAFALLKPALLILGALKIADLFQARGKTKAEGFAEGSIADSPADTLSPASPASSPGLEV